MLFALFWLFVNSWGKKIGFPQDVEQLSPAAKAQSPFLRAESAAFRVAKAFCSTFCPFFVFLYVKYLCLPERRFVIGYIYKKEDCDCRYYDASGVRKAIQKIGKKIKSAKIFNS